MSKIVIRLPQHGPRPLRVNISQLMRGRPWGSTGVWRATRRRVKPSTKVIRHALRRSRARFPTGSDADFAIRITAKVPGRGWRFFDINGQPVGPLDAPQLLTKGNYEVKLQAPQWPAGSGYGAVTASVGEAEVEVVGDPEAAAAAADDAVEAPEEMTTMAWAKLAGAAVLGFVLGRKF